MLYKKLVQPYKQRMSSEQPQGKAKQAQVQCGKSKQTQAPTEKKALTEGEIATRSAKITAFFTSYIQGCEDSRVAAELALMRFSAATLSSGVDGKPFKQHIGPSFLRNLGDHLPTVCKLATSRFFDLLRMLPKADQRSIIITVLGYFTTESMLADEIGGDIPDSERRKFHMLFLWGFQGEFFKRVCNYARRHLGARITHKWYFKVDGQAVFGDEAGVPITPSLQTVRDKVTANEASLKKKIKDNAAAVAKLDAEKETIAVKVKALPKEKATNLLQRLEVIDKRNADLVAEKCVIQAKLDHVSKLLLAIPEKVTPGTTAELFLKDENQFDDLSGHFGQKGFVLHTDPSLEFALPYSFDEIFELLAAEPKYDNILLREINEKADAILLAHNVPKVSAYPTEGAVLHVTMTFPNPSDDSVSDGVPVPSDDPVSDGAPVHAGALVPSDDPVSDGAPVPAGDSVPTGTTITTTLKFKNPNMAPM